MRLANSPVVGHEKQALAVLIQPAHGVYPLARQVDQLRYGLSPQLILHGGDHSRRLVEKQIDLLAALFQHLALVGDLVLAGLHAVPSLASTPLTAKCPFSISRSAALRDISPQSETYF